MNERVGVTSGSQPLVRRKRGYGWLRAVAIGLALVLVGLALLWNFRTSVLIGVADLWAVSDDIDDGADAIAILGGGVDMRPQAAAALYKQGLARHIVISSEGQSQVQRMGLEKPNPVKERAILIELGVPEKDISVFGNELRNTHEEAIALSAWAQEHHATRIVIPVDWSFTRRVKWVMSRELNKVGAEVEVQRLEPREVNSKNWWRTEQGVVIFQNEILKYIYYRLKY